MQEVFVMEGIGKRRISQEDLNRYKVITNTFDTVPTVETFLLFWLEQIKDTVKRSTYANYKSYIDAHICPVIGDNLITEITVDVLHYFIQIKMSDGRLDGKGGLSLKTIKEYIGLLRLAFKMAVELKLIAQNPCLNVIYPKEQKKEVRILEVAEQKKIADHVDPVWKPNSDLTIYMGEYAGLRIGEVAGLKLKDIDLESGIIRVSRSLNRVAVYEADGSVHYPLMYTSTKSDRKRNVPMNTDLKEALTVYFDTMPEDIKKDPESPLFMNTKHRAMEPRLISYHFKKTMESLNIENIHYHCLRHTFATRALEASVNMKTISEILGHASTQITSNLYTHVTIDQMMLEIKKMDMSSIMHRYVQAKVSYSNLL